MVGRITRGRADTATRIGDVAIGRGGGGKLTVYKRVAAGTGPKAFQRIGSRFGQSPAEAMHLAQAAV